MFKKFLAVLFVFVTLESIAQSDVFYAAAKSGLALRQKPDASSSLLDRIPYGTKVILDDGTESWQDTRNEGMLGYWRKVKYNNKTGYIVSSYLLPAPPPKPTVKDMAGYISQLSVPFGAKLVVKSTSKPDDDMTWELHKQLYKNGAEWHRFIGYEYDSDTYFLPEFTLEQAFLLVRLLPQFKNVFDENDPYPAETRTFKKGQHEYKITVDKETYEGGFSWTKRITVEYEDGVMYSFEMYQIDNQIVITFGAGV